MFKNYSAFPGNDSVALTPRQEVQGLVQLCKVSTQELGAAQDHWLEQVSRLGLRRWSSEPTRLAGRGRKVHDKIPGLPGDSPFPWQDIGLPVQMHCFRGVIHQRGVRSACLFVQEASPADPRLYKHTGQVPGGPGSRAPGPRLEPVQAPAHPGPAGEARGPSWSPGRESRSPATLDKSLGHIANFSFPEMR